MKTLTESIFDELIGGIKDPAELPAALKKYGHSKGPLYIALAQATIAVSEKLKAISTQYQNAEQELQQRHQAIKAAEQKLVDLDISFSVKTKELTNLEEKVKQTGEMVNQGKALAGMGFGLDKLTKSTGTTK
jgi:hypothetical protein